MVRQCRDRAIPKQRPIVGAVHEMGTQSGRSTWQRAGTKKNRGTWGIVARTRDARPDLGPGQRQSQWHPGQLPDCVEYRLSAGRGTIPQDMAQSCFGRAAQNAIRLLPSLTGIEARHVQAGIGQTNGRASR